MGNEHVEAQHKRTFKSMSEDIECGTTILTLRRTVTEAAVASACYTSSCPHRYLIPHGVRDRTLGTGLDFQILGGTEVIKRT